MPNRSGPRMTEAEGSARQARARVRRGGGATRALAVAALAMLAPHAAFAEYRLDVGDVVEIAVAGVPDLRQRSAINIDGEISVPLVGGLKAAGLPLSELRNRVREAISSKVLNQRTTEGRQYPSVIGPEEISLSIVEYRPVYLNGDVSKPGELPYRPGMTVRQAVALAGGYDLARFRMGNPILEAADLRAEYETLWTQFAKDQAQVTRLQAEAGIKAEPERRGGAQVPIPPATLAQIQANEAEQLKVRDANHEKERAYLQGAARQEDKRTAALAEQRAKEDEGTQADIADFDRVNDLFRKGSVPITRLTDARRLILLSSTRALQTGVQLAQVERERQDLGRKLQRLDDQRRMEALPLLQEANVKLAATRARLQAVGDKLLYSSTIRSQLVRGTGNAPELVIVRKTDQGRTRIPGAEDVELLPGDVVEVSLRSELLAGTPAP